MMAEPFFPHRVQLTQTPKKNKEIINKKQQPQLEGDID